MIDTFVFRVHNLSAHYPMITTCYESESGKATLQTKSQIKAKKMEHRLWMHDYRNEVVIPLRYTDKRKIESSNHDIPFTIDWNADYLEANVSIPKMIFGTNVCELIIPPGHKDYSVNNTSPWNQVNFIWDMLLETVKKVMYAVAKDNFIELQRTDIEIVRLDICVNQHFENKAEALRYLEHQKGIHKKHSRTSGGASNAASWKTSITFKTKRYYAKIYHKGTEFQQLQQKYIIEINKDRKAKGLSLHSSKLSYAAKHIKELQEYSDCILRYELEFTKSYLNYLFNHKINKQWSDDWRKCIKVYNFFSANEDLRRDIFKYEIRYVNENGIESKDRPVLVRHTNLYHKRYNGDEKKFEYAPFTYKESVMLTATKMLGYHEERSFKIWYKKMTKELTRGRKMMVGLDKHLPDYTRKTCLVNGIRVKNDVFDETPGDVRFTRTLIYVMLQQFEVFFKGFQVVSKQPESVLEDKIESFNQHIHSLISATRVFQDIKDLKKQLISAQMKRTLLQYHFLHSKFSFKQLVPRHFSRANYYRVSKLYSQVTGQKHQIAHAHFSHLIERDIHKIYEKLYSDINFSFLTNFYNKAPSFLGSIKM